MKGTYEKQCESTFDCLKQIHSKEGVRSCIFFVSPVLIPNFLDTSPRDYSVRAYHRLSLVEVWVQNLTYLCLISSPKVSRGSKVTVDLHMLLFTFRLWMPWADPFRKLYPRSQFACKLFRSVFRPFPRRDKWSPRETSLSTGSCIALRCCCTRSRRTARRRVGRRLPPHSSDPPSPSRACGIWSRRPCTPCRTGRRTWSWMGRKRKVWLGGGGGECALKSMFAQHFLV